MKRAKIPLLYLALSLCFFLVSFGFFLGTRLQNRGPELPSQPPAAAASPEELRLDLNRATLDELSSLPGIGEGLAEQILALRRELGSFSSWEDLDRVEGLGETRLTVLMEYFFLEGSP